MAQNLMDIISNYVGTNRGDYNQGLEWTIQLSFARLHVIDQVDDGSDRVGEWHSITRTITISHADDVLLSAHKIISGEEAFDSVDNMAHEQLTEPEWTVEIDRTHGEFLARLKELFSGLAKR